MISARSSLLSFLGIVLISSACEPDPGPVDDDDSAAGDDDDSAVGDDDDTGSACDAVPGMPVTMTFAGAHSGDFTFDTLACEDYNGDVWNMTYTDSTGANPWRVRVQAGPLPTAGEMVGGNMVITLLNNSESPTITVSGMTQQGHVAAVDVVDYQAPAAPCLWWTTEPVGTAGNEVTVSPQPMPLRCP